MSYIDSKNCSEHLITNEMGLDRAPFEFQKMVFFGTPYSPTLGRRSTGAPSAIIHSIELLI